MSYADPSRASGNHPPAVQTEHAGPIASDSLAADSLRSGGDFASNDPTNPQPSSVPGAKSTLTNPDTSGAVPLHPASSGAAREKQDALGLGADEKGASGVKYPDVDQPSFSGTTTSEGGYYGGPSADRPTQGYDTSSSAADSTEPSLSATGGLPSTSSTSGSSAMPSGTSTSSSTNTGPSTGTGARPYVDDAPTYSARTAGNIRETGELKPKGTNLTEGGIPETKTFLGNVGGPHDPGRVAERGFEKVNAQVAGGGKGDGSGTGDGFGRDGDGGDKGGFEVLGGSERA